MHEFNPMLGFRGCRLGILYPEITQIQARAILQAAAETDTVPEIMIPLVGFQTELVDQKEIIEKISAEVNH
jgi:pyruvate,orthophosphate dikinase